MGIPASRSPVAIALAAAALVTLVLLAFSWPSVTAEPRDLPVAVTGPEQAVSQIQTAIGDDGAVALESVDTRQEAVNAIEERDVYGAIVLADGPEAAPEVLVASAANPQVAQNLGDIAQLLGQQTNTEVEVTDVVPLSDDDSLGTGLTAASLPMVISGVIGGALIALAVTGALRRLAALGIFAVTGGLAFAGVLQGWYGVLQGDYWQNAAAIALTLGAISATLIGLFAVLGRAGLGLGAVLSIPIGNPMSGATVPADFLPGPWGEIGQWLPPGAASTLLRTLSYFPEASTVLCWTILGGWAVVGVILTLLDRSRRSAVAPATVSMSS